MFVLLRKFLSAVFRRFKSLCFKTSNLLNLASKKLVLDANVKFQASVRCDGDGLVVVGEGVVLGFHGAPTFGNGQILLQARTANSCIRIGAWTHLSNCVSIVSMSEVSIGSNCLIGDQVYICDSDFHNIDPKLRNSQVSSKPVHIHDNVWIGAKAMILKGVTIGTDSVVGAGAIVTADVPPKTVVAGIPAKVIRNI